MEIVNKYGIKIDLPTNKTTNPVKVMDKILSEANIPHELEYKLNSCKRQPFDIAIMKNGKPCLLIEYDGEPHYDSDYYVRMGNRPERSISHVVRSGIGDAKKLMQAYMNGIPCVRFNNLHMKHIRDLLLAYVSVFYDGIDLKQGNEVLLIDMLDKYGWDFEYIEPSSKSKAESLRIQQHNHDKYD